jgi:hypothetical protein
MNINTNVEENKVLIPVEKVEIEVKRPTIIVSKQQTYDDFEKELYRNLREKIKQNIQIFDCIKFSKIKSSQNNMPTDILKDTEMHIEVGAMKEEAESKIQEENKINPQILELLSNNTFEEKKAKGHKKSTSIKNKQNTSTSPLPTILNKALGTNELIKNTKIIINNINEINPVIVNNPISSLEEEESKKPEVKSNKKKKSKSTIKLTQTNEGSINLNGVNVSDDTQNDKNSNNIHTNPTTNPTTNTQTNKSKKKTKPKSKQLNEPVNDLINPETKFDINSLSSHEENIIKPVSIRSNNNFAPMGNKIIINNYYNIFNQNSSAFNLVNKFPESEKNIVIINVEDESGKSKLFII